MYLSKFNPKCEALFQHPRRDWTEANGAVQTVWYENRPLGVNTLGSAMKEISEKAVLSTVYTNHCVRATAITLWSEAGLADRNICHISGHRNPSSPSSTQLRNCSGALSYALTGSIQTTQMQQMSSQQFQSVSSRQPGEMSSTVVESHRSTSSNTAVIHSEMLGGMFNSCTISLVQINLNLLQSTEK